MIEKLGLRPGEGADAVEEREGVGRAGAAGTAEVADVLEAAAGGEDRGTVSELLVAPGVAHLARPIDLGTITAALARVCGRTGDSRPEVARMRDVAVRYLALRLEVAEGVARIAVG